VGKGATDGSDSEWFTYRRRKQLIVRATNLDHSSENDEERAALLAIPEEHVPRRVRLAQHRLAQLPVDPLADLVEELHVPCEAHQSPHVNILARCRHLQRLLCKLRQHPRAVFLHRYHEQLARLDGRACV
jgi:DNA-directed RNA polymerase specialized sigma24 family protein